MTKRSAGVAKSTELMFRIGMVVKAIDSVFEVIGGIRLMMPTKLSRFIDAISQHEAFRHHQVLTGRLNKLSDSITMHASIGEGVYLMVHGLAKVILIGAIVCRKKWGYQGFIVILGLFSAIELVRAFTAREIVTGIFGAFDVCVVLLIFKEYRARF